MKVQGHGVQHCEKGCGGVLFSTHSREKNGTMSACYEGDKRGNGRRKRQTGAAASLNIYLRLCTHRGEERLLASITHLLQL